MKRSGFKRAEPREAQCEQCGGLFVSRPTYMGRTKYCSRACYGLANRRRDERECTVCGAEFETRHSRTKKTCSDRCSRAAKSRSKIAERNPNFKGDDSYKERLARWDASRGDACARCGGGGVLHLHHVIYRQEVKRRRGDVWDPRNGITLCVACHASHHKNLHENTLPLEVLRDENYAYARELLGTAAELYLRRRYGGTDARFEALAAA